ncbi:DUF1349 domain-containing protein [Microbacterium sp. YY-01]|uniref:DUF1349 domain-containing protein n=1 Tax=Microbacterium sp. YY-01 TaxID=3421634 RepID=UPI003D165A67
MIAWNTGTWLNEPPTHTVTPHDQSLTMTTAKGSDAWRDTAYGFVFDTAHALLHPIAVGEAMQIDVTAPWEGQFDQAGLLIRAGADHWIKTGLEYADGHLGLGAVVTQPHSDWSTGIVDEWLSSTVSLRISRWADCIIVRAKAAAEPWRLVRVAPFATDPSAPVHAGPYAASPLREGLNATFQHWQLTPADTDVHEQPST